MCNGATAAAADYLFCATRSGDIVKLYVDFLAANEGSKNASVVIAAAVKKASTKQGINAGKFTGGMLFIIMTICSISQLLPATDESRKHAIKKSRQS